MPTIRLTAFFRDDDGNGWSETHDKDGGSSITSLTTYLANFDSLMKVFRVPLLCGDSYYIGCRASYRTADGTIAGDNLLNDPPIRGPQTVGGVSLEMGPPNSAVKMRLRNDASTARSDAYIRGQPSQLVLAGILNFGGIVGTAYKTRFDNYAAQLIGLNYGWVGTSPASTSRGEVTNYTTPVDGGQVTFTVAVTNAVPLPAVGTRLSVKFARINDSKSVLNRALVCKVVSPTSLITVQNVAVGAFESAGTYIATAKGFIPYAAVSYYKRASRKCGRPFGLQPGRAQVRALS